jgi:hydroxyacylglutathione hydrolase
MNNNLIVKQIDVGPMANFSYLIGCRSTGECLVVDPAWDIDKIVQSAALEKLKIVGALVSHYHPDHVGGHLWGHDIAGLAELLNYQTMPIYANKKEIDGIITLTGLSSNDLTPVDSGQDIKVGTVNVKAIHTPGHTPGSQCFLCDEQFLFAGDTLFLSGCGRVDLPGGNADDLYASLHQKIAKLSDSTIVFPGHDYDSKKSDTLAHVKNSNPYLKAESLSEWHSLMQNRQ